MGKTFRGSNILEKGIALLLVSVVFTACVPTSSKNVRSRLSANATNSTVGVTQGKVLLDNPIILSNQASLSLSYDLNKLTSVATITSNSFLQGNVNCSGLTYCFEVRSNRDSTSALQTKDGKWGYTASTDEFLQVNTYYHLNKIFDQFFTNIGLSYGGAYDFSGFPIYDTAIPTNIYDSNGAYNLNTQTLMAFANCDVENNATYDQATESLCFGYSGSSKQLRWAHDSTIVYHEAGHFFQRLQLNFRNTGLVTKAQLGNYLYTEAGSLGEGLSDFFSYYVNGRTHWGEWAAGKLGGSRPLSESDALHVPGISTDDDQRLSYPQYLTYDPNDPEIPAEDIHVSGMIISHYLTALSQDLQAKCSMTSKDAREFVMTILNETMAELGDLTSKGTIAGTAGKVNMDATRSSLWLAVNNPINYRSFTQTIAKNLLLTVGNPGLNRCNGTYYTRDNIESLLDNYGLLLFKTYNQHRNLTNTSTNINTAVTSTNRKKSVLISKNSLILDPTSGASSAYVIDNRTQIANGVTQLQSSGLIGTMSALTPSDFGFNNGNSKVSPGEVVAIALNLYNNSNSQMGGIEVLANDWDHADSTGKPCQFDTSMSSDQWPLSSEGASTDTASCSTISETNYAPVCFIQSNESNATKWISQKEFKEKMAIDTNNCLDKSDDKDCFIRAIKGVDRATFSKINPKSTWGQTMANPKTGKAYGLDWGNLILFEVSKNVPPGTVVDCRLRVRFTNCEDCYHDSTRNNNDYFDREYNGPRPYKIIHLQIPITD